MQQQAANGDLPVLWTSADIKHVKWLTGQEAVVIVRHQDAQGNPLRFRWWLTKRTGAWQIYDFQDLDAGLRLSTLVGSLTTMNDADIAAVGQALRSIREASDAGTPPAASDGPEAADFAALAAKLLEILETPVH